jgi:DNA polymerase I-like protein with 3'-5' exonuclease and polymerase domains
LRSLIAPSEGRAIAYVDWSQQEWAIAAVLSGDPAMIAAYESGDVYTTFAKQAGAIPPNGSKETHPEVRERFKTCALGIQYGMAAESLAHRIGGSVAEARMLLDAHRATYPVFWRWSDAAVDHAMLRGWLHTVFGWRIHIGGDVNPRSIRNFPVQSNGAEMLRLACCLATERGIKVCAPVHDALLIEAPTDRIDEAVAATQAAMTEASEVVLNGFRLRSDVKIVRHPDRYIDPRGERMWRTVQDILREVG